MIKHEDGSVEEYESSGVAIMRTVVPWVCAGATTVGVALVFGAYAFVGFPLAPGDTPGIYTATASGGGSGAAPDQVIDWGLYTDYDDAAASDSMLSQIGTENTNSVTIVDSLPSPNDFAGTYNGSYMTRMWSQMAAPGIAGFNVEIPNAWSVSTRVIYERFYLMFNRQYQGVHNGDSLFNMAAGSCAGSGSAGLKTSLWQWWSADQTSSGTRSDFIVRDGDISINHANNEPFSGSYNSDAMLDGEWHLVELAFDPGSFGANGEAKYEMWVDDNMVHAIPHPFADRDGLVNDSYRLGHSAWTDTFNCEEEFALYAAGDTLTVIVSPIERWWSAVPGWYTAKPSRGARHAPGAAQGEREIRWLATPHSCRKAGPRSFKPVV